MDVGWNETVQANKRFGSFLDNPELFDAALFGVPNPEAQAMDSQQRLLLETSFEAMQGATIRDLPGIFCTPQIQIIQIATKTALAAHKICTLHVFGAETTNL